VTHYFGGGSTASLDFRGINDWWNYLNPMALRYDTAVKVTLVASRQPFAHDAISRATQHVRSASAVRCVQ
jgi:hypothetical protein